LEAKAVAGNQNATLLFVAQAGFTIVTSSQNCIILATVNFNSALETLCVVILPAIS
jgi:hypothetical protein